MKPYSWILIGFTLLAMACEQKPDNLKLLDEFVVSTNYDPDADFNTYATYAIPTDTIGFASNNSRDTIITHSKSDFPRPVLQAIQASLDARGYQRVDRKASPDLGVNVTLANDFNVFQQVVYPGGYGGYYGGYYGYSGWYYQPYVNTYAYNTGVLVIEIIDLKNRTPDNKVKIIWNSYMGDVYSSLDYLQQSKDAISQAFEQSGYLKR
jgi:hypothetical protein